MTSGACAWGVGIITIVARYTLIRDQGMGSVQLIVIIVYGKRGRIPIRCCRMTGDAVCRYIERHMVRVGGLVKVCGVACTAFGRRPFKSCCMTIQAVDGDMRSCQWKVRLIMIKHAFGAARWMTRQAYWTTIYISVYPVMLLVCFRIGMTGDTGKY